MRNDYDGPEPRAVSGGEPEAEPSSCETRYATDAVLGLGLLPALWLFGPGAASAPGSQGPGSRPPNPFLLSPEERARLEQGAPKTTPT